MPELPVLSGADVIEALKRLGFEQVRQMGSHVVLRQGERGCVVPLHRELKRETLASILRQASVDTAELIAQF